MVREKRRHCVDGEISTCLFPFAYLKKSFHQIFVSVLQMVKSWIKCKLHVCNEFISIKNVIYLFNAHRLIGSRIIEPANYCNQIPLPNYIPKKYIHKDVI